jgi:hypothetical protein
MEIMYIDGKYCDFKKENLQNIEYSTCLNKKGLTAKFMAF